MYNIATIVTAEVVVIRCLNQLTVRGVFRMISLRFLIRLINRKLMDGYSP